MRNMITTIPSRISIVPCLGYAPDGGEVVLPKTTEELQTLLTGTVEKATAGLKANEAALKDEKKAIKASLDELTAQLAALGGKDGVAALVKQREQLQKDELGRLLADGKHDEWFDRRMAARTAEHEKVLKAKDEELVKEREGRTSAEKRLEKTHLSSGVRDAALAAKTLTEVGVIRDIERAASEVFVWDVELQKLVIKDDESGIVMGKDGKTPKTLGEWLEEQQPTSRHWWPPSTGGGSGGGGRPKGQPDLASMTQAEYEKTRKEQGTIPRY